MIDLAQQIVRDGEGAQKFVTVRVEGAATAIRPRADRACRSPIRRWSRPRSPAEDANWGRIVMAVGKAGEKADRDKLRDFASAAC